MTDYTSSISINLLAPHLQEVFSASEWSTGNTGLTKYINFNECFAMLFRVVDVSKKLLEKKVHLAKKSPETLDITGGQELTMGSPQNVLDPDPTEIEVAENKLAVFSNLPSVVAARKAANSLNISYDCEYQSVDKNGNPDPAGEYRIILSYQFALYLNENEILEVCFITRNPSISNRLGYRNFVGAILDLLRDEFNYDYLSIAYSSTKKEVVSEKRHIFEGSEETYKTTRVFDDSNEAIAYIQSQNPLIVVDTSHISKNDYKESRKKALRITIVCHAGVVDLSAFKDDLFGIGKRGKLLTTLKSVQGGLVSMESIFTHIPSASKYWKFYPIQIDFKDTMCYAPASSKSLAALGDSIEVPKIKLPEDAIGNMLEYLETTPEDFIAYAAQDALVTLIYGSRLWGINKEWPLTSTSGSAFAMKQSIMAYYNITGNSKSANKIFERKYRGMQTVSKGKHQTPNGLRPISTQEPINPDVKLLHDFAANSYAGGYNTCIISGVFRNSKFYDFDLESAYPTAMCLVMDIDFDNDNPIEREFKNEDLTLQAFHTPVDPMFCYIDFEFPSSVKFPCIAIHDDGSIVFPRKAKGVYASGPSMYLALMLGAKIFVRRGFVGRIRLTQDNQKSMCLRAACKQMVQDRKIAKGLYGSNSLEQALLKLFVNGAYGKIAQNVIEKHTWDSWNEYMTDIGCSSITSPERAALITDIVRCMLIGTLNQLWDMGIKSYSVTTDGFITKATLGELNSCDAFGFKQLFEQSRMFLTDGDPTVWAVKHEMTELVNPTTRCNTGFGVDKEKADGSIIPSGLGVLAHGGYVSKAKEKDSYEDKFLTTQTILTRTGRVPYTVTEFINAKDMNLKNIDFHTYQQTRNIRLDFDMKRKPVKDSFEKVSGNLEGIDYEYANFETEPFEDLDEYHLYRNVNSSFECLRTMDDWNRFFLKLVDRKNGYKRVTKDMEWSKLFSVIQGYRSGLWDLPEVTAAESVAEKIEVINRYNHSNKSFKDSDWKNARKPERASQMLPEELLLTLLEEFNYISL